MALLGRRNRNQYGSFTDGGLNLPTAWSPQSAGSGQGQYRGVTPSYTAPEWGGTTPSPTFGQGGDAPEAPSRGDVEWGTMPPTDFEKWMASNDDWRTAAGNYFATQLPIQQFLQNTFQYGRDFSESARRWNEATRWQQMLDAYDAMLAGRQQQLAEGQTEAAADQWAKQFGYQQDLDARTMALERELQSLNAFGRSLTPGARFVRNWG